MVNANEGFTANLTMTGGTFSSTGGGAFNINPGAANAPSINTNASATTALISANVVQRNATISLPFNVASGTTASGRDLTVSGVISGAGGGITKNGAGTMLLTAVNTYTGPTTVNAGTLLVSGTGSTTASSGGDGHWHRHDARRHGHLSVEPLPSATGPSSRRAAGCWGSAP